MNVRSVLMALALLGGSAAAVVPAQALAQAAASGGFSVETSTISDLLASPAAKAVLEKHIPEIVGNPQISQAGSMTLKAIQSYAADQLTDEKLAKIDTDLKALPKS